MRASRLSRLAIMILVASFCLSPRGVQANDGWFFVVHMPQNPLDAARANVIQIREVDGRHFEFAIFHIHKRTPHGMITAYVKTVHFADFSDGTDGREVSLEIPANTLPKSSTLQLDYSLRIVTTFSAVDDRGGRSSNGPGANGVVSMIETQ
jgi:hypothetical protein